MAAHSSILVRRMPTDRGAWQATVHRVAKSQTRQATSHTHTHTHDAPLSNQAAENYNSSLFFHPPHPAMETHVEKDVYLDSETVNS